MKKAKILNRGNQLKNNNRRRLMLKRAHQKVLQRRKQYQSYDMFTQLDKVN